VRCATSNTITPRPEGDLMTHLDKLAGGSQRSSLLPAAEAIREFVGNDEWQIRQIQAELTEAEHLRIRRRRRSEALAKK
jgi:RHH-type transcriptional regulator, rel operon repressor / antitoxin RelB